MEKHILEQYSDTQARIRLLRSQIDRLSSKVDKMSTPGYFVSDTVTRGKKGKKPLGTASVSGFPHREYDRERTLLNLRKIQLEEEEKNLLEEMAAVEEYISGIQSVELRNIFTLYYIEDLNWVRVAHRMNTLYNKKKKYTEGSCRLKHDRFLKKN